MQLCGQIDKDGQTWKSAANFRLLKDTDPQYKHVVVTIIIAVAIIIIINAPIEDLTAVIMWMVFSLRCHAVL
jgi:hypothetical protein